MSDTDLLAGVVERLMSDHCPPSVVEDADGGWSEPLWAQLERAGLTDVGVPEESGGSGGGLRDVATILSIAAAHAAPLPVNHALLCAPWLRTTFGEDHVPGPFSVATSASLRAVPDDSGWRLSGNLGPVPYGHLTRGTLALARDEDGGQVVLATLAAADVEWSRGRNVAGEPLDSAEVDLVVPRVKALPLAGHEGLSSELRDLEALGQSIMMVGAMRTAQRLSVQYSLQREQFGKKIASFQAVRQMVAVLAGDVAVSGAATDAALAVLAQEGTAPFPISAAQVRCAAAATTVSRIAHQVHGAMGYTREHPLHHYTRRLWAWRDEGTSEEEWIGIAGRRALEHGPDRLWQTIVG